MFSIGSPTIAYLRTGSQTNSATVSMNYCKPSENLGGLFNQSETYQVSNFIKSTQNISNGNTVKYQAGTFIELNNGFVSGNDFVAEINPCISNVTIIAAKTDDEQIDVYEDLQESYNNVSNNNWLKVYPNILPSGNSITVEIKESIDRVELKMYDLQGRHVQSFILNSILENSTLSVRLPDLPSGVYVLKARNTNNLFTQKILIQ